MSEVNKFINMVMILRNGIFKRNHKIVLNNDLIINPFIKSYKRRIIN